jgi:hypothetical protein
MRLDQPPIRLFVFGRAKDLLKRTKVTISNIFLSPPHLAYIMADNDYKYTFHNKFVYSEVKKIQFELFTKIVK